MRMIGDYAARYGGPPALESPWHLFVGLLRQCARLEARDFLRAIDGPAWSQAGPDGHAQRLLVYQTLTKTAGYD